MSRLLSRHALAGLATVLFLSGAQAVSASSFVLNGGFETYTGPGPAPGDNAVQMLAGGVTGWTNGNIGESLVFPSWYANGVLFSCCGGVGVAGWPAFPQSSPDGGNFLFSDGDFMNSPIDQTITGLSPGSSYVLTFYQSLVQDVQPFPASSYYITTPGPVTGGWQVSLGSNTQYSSPMSADGSIPTFSSWSLQTMTFTAQNATEVLSFLSIGTGDPPLVGLDGITLEAAPSEVPEPASLTLVGLGMGLAARKIRARRRQSA